MKINGNEVLKNAIDLMHIHPDGFFVTDLFRLLYPNEKVYVDPVKKTNPMPLYSKLLYFIRTSKHFVRAGKKIKLRNYQVIPADKPLPPRPPKRKNAQQELFVQPISNPGWLKRLVRYLINVW